MPESPRRIEPGLVPTSLWLLSAYRLLPRPAWGRIRREVIEEFGGACTACGVVRDKGMVCDEVWSYDDDANGATLVRLRLLCRDCDVVNHLGFTRTRGYADVALAHMATVNGMTMNEVYEVEDAAFKTWAERSAHDWTTAVAPGLLERFPDLAVLDGLTAQRDSGSHRLRNAGH
jgi:hypothetical protein